MLEKLKGFWNQHGTEVIVGVGTVVAGVVVVGATIAVAKYNAVESERWQESLFNTETGSRETYIVDGWTHRAWQKAAEEAEKRNTTAK